MRYTLLLTLFSSLLASFSFSQTKESSPETKVVNGKKFVVVNKIETDKSKLKMLSPDNSKKIIVNEKKTAIIDPKNK
jgi:hypothetical protein